MILASRLFPNTGVLPNTLEVMNAHSPSSAQLMYLPSNGTGHSSTVASYVPSCIGTGNDLWRGRCYRWLGGVNVPGGMWPGGLTVGLLPSHDGENRWPALPKRNAGQSGRIRALF